MTLKISLVMIYKCSLHVEMLLDYIRDITLIIKVISKIRFMRNRYAKKIVSHT